MSKSGGYKSWNSRNGFEYNETPFDGFDRWIFLVITSYEIECMIETIHQFIHHVISDRLWFMPMQILHFFLQFFRSPNMILLKAGMVTKNWNSNVGIYPKWMRSTAYFEMNMKVAFLFKYNLRCGVFIQSK
mmetsp:Transcript_12031/g.16532  ORF Transcript_12031/g.16532 Transcript_12031/m.16532 type:complete len:131 (+) Transcript_12031:1932-2324(+)